jgi:hypothetical protein
MATKKNEKNDRIDLQQHERLAVYGVRRFVRKDQTEDSSWTLIGTAFRCGDGSLNLVLDYVPASGANLNIRPFKPRAEA